MVAIVLLQWRLSVYYKRESMWWVLKLIEMVNTDNLNWGMTPLIWALKVKTHDSVSCGLRKGGHTNGDSILAGTANLQFSCIQNSV